MVDHYRGRSVEVARRLPTRLGCRHVWPLPIVEAAGTHPAMVQDYRLRAEFRSTVECGTDDGPFGRPLERGNERALPRSPAVGRSEEHTSELQSLMHISYAVFCLKKKTQHQ